MPKNLEMRIASNRIDSHSTFFLGCWFGLGFWVWVFGFWVWVWGLGLGFGFGFGFGFEVGVGVGFGCLQKESGGPSLAHGPMGALGIYHGGQFVRSVRSLYIVTGIIPKPVRNSDDESGRPTAVRECKKGQNNNVQVCWLKRRV